MTGQNGGRHGAGNAWKSRGLGPPSEHVGRGREVGGGPLGKGVGLCIPRVCVQCALL